MPKRTYQPSTKKKLRKHGFLALIRRSSKIIKRRRDKGRTKLSKSSNKRYK